MTATATQEKPKELVVVEERKRHEASLPATTKATSLVEALAQAAADPRMDVTKIERLYAMHKEMMEREAEVAFNDAMARAQSEILPVAAKAWNSQTTSSYAKLEAIDRVITPIHTRHGLSISYDTETKNDADPVPEGYLRIVAWVRHAGGHKVRHHIDLPPDGAGLRGNANKTPVQAIGSTNAYGRRYLKLMIFNVSTFDDKDGNRSGGNGAGHQGEELDEKQKADFLAAMDAAADRPALMKSFADAMNAAEAAKDPEAKRVFMAKRDERLPALTKGARR